MCGRYAFTESKERIMTEFELETAPDMPPRYNVAPSQKIAVVGLKPDGRRRGIAALQWGLVPSWANDPATAHKPINARAETLHEKPTFRDCFQKKRCLIPISGFFEWSIEGNKKVPHYFTLASGEIMAIAGLWDAWESLRTCCLVTVSANEVVRQFHDRMPAVIGREEFAKWLDPKTPVKELQAMLRPSAAEFRAVTVGAIVNSPNNDVPGCIQVVD